MIGSLQPSEPPGAPSLQPVALGRVRWWIVWTVFFSTVINYVNRQTFSVLSPVIAAQLHFSHTDLAKVIGAFQLSYALTWLAGGIFLDAVGTRIGLAVAVVWWSLVNMAMGFANSLSAFVGFRFMLGIGEGLNWPGPARRLRNGFRSRRGAWRSQSSTAARASEEHWRRL